LGQGGGGGQSGFKNRAVDFQVGPEFKDLPIDGYKLSLNPVAGVEFISLKIEDFFLITNGCESPFLYIPWYCHSVGLQKR
jgi:hypothetical protein